jgi:transposase
MMEPVPTDAEIAGRRDRALSMARENFSQTYIANKLNVSQPTVSRWLHGTHGFGTSRVSRRDETARQKPQIGRAPQLTVEQLRAIVARCNPTTGSEFQTAIFDAFAVRYSPGYCCGLLTHLRSVTPGTTRFDIHRHRD